jgi:hypothetical protein
VRVERRWDTSSKLAKIVMGLFFFEDMVGRHDVTELGEHFVQGRAKLSDP